MYRVSGYGVPACRKHGVGKTRGVVNKTQGLMENTGCGKHGVQMKNTGEPLFRPTVNFLMKVTDPNYVILNCNENQ